MKRIKPKAPAIVIRKMFENQMEMREWAMFIAFQRGVANADHYYVLVDIANILMFAGATDDSRRYVVDYIQKEITPVIDSIRERFKRTDKIGCNGVELNKIRALIEFNDDFWKRQCGELYSVVLTEYNKMLQDKRKINDKSPNG